MMTHNNINWHCSSFVDDFICPNCQKEHKYLHIQWTEEGNVWELSSSISEKSCELLDKFKKGIIYDLTGKILEEVIENEFERKMISKRLIMVKKEYKNNQRDKIIWERLDKKQIVNGLIDGDLEKAGITLIKDNNLFACDKCGRNFTSADLKEKNYRIDYSKTICCGIKSWRIKKICNICHRSCGSFSSG